MSGAGSANVLTFNLTRAFTSDESVYFRLGVSEQEQATPPADIADVEVEFVSSSGTTGPLPVPAPNRMSRLYISDPTASSPSNASIMSTIRLPARCFGATETSPLNATSIRLHYNRNQDDAGPRACGSSIGYSCWLLFEPVQASRGVRGSEAGVTSDAVGGAAQPARSEPLPRAVSSSTSRLYPRWARTRVAPY
jgi:hypothetical protein